MENSHGSTQLKPCCAEQDRRSRLDAERKVREIIKGLMNTEFRSITIISGKCEHTEQLTSAYKSALEDLEDLLDEGSLTPKDE